MKKRVRRGLDRLRGALARRKVIISVAGLASYLSSNAAEACAEGLQATIASSAMQATAAS